MSEVPLELLRNGPNGPLPYPTSSQFPSSIQPPQPVHYHQHLSSRNPTPDALESSEGRRENSISGLRRMFRGKRSRLRDDRDSNLVQINLEELPRGYPRIAAYIDSDMDTVLFRRFAILHARSLLYKQVELTDLEDQLKKLDKDDEGEEGLGDNWRVRYSIHLDNGYENEKRRDLIQAIEKKLKEYDELLLLDARLRKLQRPSQRVHRNFFDFVINQQPFDDDDQRFVYHEHDFVSLEEYEESLVELLVYRISASWRYYVLKLFVTRKDQAKTTGLHLHRRYYSERRQRILIKAIIAFIPTVLLVLPIFVFIGTNCSVYIMSLITLIFIFVFAVALSGLTTAKRQEVFGATAAYCAVLVVFIGNLQQGQVDK